MTPVVFVGKEYRKTLFSAQYVKMDSQAVQWCTWGLVADS